MSVSQERDVVDRFEEFFRRYYDDREDGTSEIGKLAQQYPKEKRSLVIAYSDLYQYDPDLAEDTREHPDEFLRYAEEALSEYDLPADIEFSPRVRLGGLDQFPHDRSYDVGDYPADKDGELVRVTGQVSKVAQARGRLVNAAWECQRCGTMTKVPDGSEPYECQGCERSGPFAINWSESEKTDHQLVRLQRPPEKSRGGTASDTIDIDLEEDLVGRVSPGDRVDIATILRPELDDEEKATFVMTGEANAIEHQESDYEDLDLGEYEDEILAIANSSNPIQQIIDSVKPSHQGDDDIKEAIALQMFGGVKKEMPDGSTKRGNSHILLIGDPGCDKSGLLQYAKELSPRSVYTSGKSATGAGLTCAAVQSDFGDGGWTLEAGALVKAHKGLAAIDELDKIDEDDRAGVQEALAQGTISPSKAGISNVTLPAEATVLAAANPKHGRFDRYESVGQQIDLDPTLISRFDLIFTLSDSPDKVKDEKLADHLNKTAVVGEKIASGEEITEEEADAVEPAIDPEVMRHYIAYAKENITPVLTEEAQEVFKQFYVSTRLANGDKEDTPVPVTARKLEALHRLGEAAARIRLSDRVTETDAERVVELVKGCLEDVGVDPETGEYDADVIETGHSKAQRDRIQALKDTVKELSMQNESGAPVDEVVETLVNDGFRRSKVTDEIENQKTAGELYEPRDGYLRSP